MNKPNIESILTNHPFYLRTDDMANDQIWDAVKDAMKEYGKQMFNYALELAAENATTDIWGVDKESILKLKIP